MRGVAARMDEISKTAQRPKTQAIIARLLTPRTELRYHYAD